MLLWLVIIAGTAAVIHLWGWLLLIGIAVAVVGYQIEILAFILRERRIYLAPTKDDCTMLIGIRSMRVTFAAVVLMISVWFKIRVVTVGAIAAMYFLGVFHAAGMIRYRRNRHGKTWYMRYLHIA